MADVNWGLSVGVAGAADRAPHGSCAPKQKAGVALPPAAMIGRDDDGSAQTGVAAPSPRLGIPIGAFGGNSRRITT
jgi:hypothetical protein